MNLYDSAYWWPLGKNILKEIYSGIIADDKNFNDSIIENEDMLINFKENIATNVVIGNVNDYEFFSNKEDVFLNNRIEINFKENFILVIMSAEIKCILFSEIFQCYLVMVDDKSVDRKVYSAGICPRIEGVEKLGFKLLNSKPDWIYDMYRPTNNNDEY